MEQIPYIAHEAMMSRMERTIKRLWILCIILIILLVGSNVAWLLYESQFEDTITTETYTKETFSGDGGHAIINDSGEGIINGEGEDNQN